MGTVTDLASLRACFDQFVDAEAIYFDNAATTFVPRRIAQVVSEHLRCCVGSVHRGAHKLAEMMTEQFENARQTIAGSIGAAPTEIVFTYNASQAMALVATLLLRKRRRVFLSRYDHHSTILPWQLRYDVEYLGCDTSGQVDVDSLLGDELNDSVVVVSHVSNVTGLVQPVAELARVVANQGGLVVIDGSQSYPQIQIDVRALGCHFFVFSPHKAFGLPGVGVLFVDEFLHRTLEAPVHGGGTVEKVSLEHGVVSRPFPYALELGSPNTVGVIAAAEAARFLAEVRAALPTHCAELRGYLCERLLPRFSLLGGPATTAGIGPMTIAWPESSEHISRLLSQRFGIMVRGGYHCAHPLHREFESRGGLRLSPFHYNSREECDIVVDALSRLTSRA